MNPNTLKNALLALALTCPITTLAADARIVGGHDAKPGQWPWMVALATKGIFPYDGQFCGGTLIRPDWVITAAHCLQGETTKTFDVVADIFDLTEDNGQRVAVKRIFKQPDFNPISLDSDLALLQLAKPVTDAISLPLFDGSTTLSGLSATIIGWGLLNENEDTYPGALQEVDLPIQPNSTCIASYGKSEFTDNMLCAGLAQGGKDSCSGDSGGPLMVQQNGAWVLAGITSWGSGCARPDLYGVYTRVAKFVGFVDKIIAVDYFALADANHDQQIDELDKAAKNAELLAQFQTWKTQCWQAKASCADVNHDRHINQSDYSNKKNKYQQAYRNWLATYWLPETI